ncbi:hypothetical protein AB4144_42765, partial [Rhizobiaceae sp. 2RAB30]
MLSAEDVELLAALEPDVMEERFEDSAPQTHASRAAEPGNLDFNVAMADVDMDFGDEPKTSLEQGYGAYDGEPLQAGEINFDDEDVAALDDVETVQAEEAPLLYVPAARAAMAESVETFADVGASDENDQEEE